MFSLNDCLWISEDETDIFEDQNSKNTSKQFSLVSIYDLEDWMLCLNDCLCLFYCPNALIIIMRKRRHHLQDQQLLKMYITL